MNAYSAFSKIVVSAANIFETQYEKNPNRDIKEINKNTAKSIQESFNHNLFRNIDDVYGKNNSQRQFFTNPVTTIPNEQTKFANWLYNVPKTCKENNGNQCVANNYTPLYTGSRNII